jgi:hypothetical protein
MPAQDVLDRRQTDVSLAVAATAATVLFNGGLFFVSAFGMLVGIRPPFFPGPTSSATDAATYFQTHAVPVLLASSLQFSAAIVLVVLVAAIVSRFHASGTRSAATYVAFAGGIVTAVDMMVSNGLLWAIVRPQVLQRAAIVAALHQVSFIFGGPGFSVPFGLFAGGVVVAARSGGALPRWVVRLGCVVATAGVLSIVSWLLLPMHVRRAILLVPLTRFPGFLWLLATGFTFRDRKPAP